MFLSISFILPSCPQFLLMSVHLNWSYLLLFSVFPQPAWSACAAFLSLSCLRTWFYNLYFGSILQYIYITHTLNTCFSEKNLCHFQSHILTVYILICLFICTCTRTGLYRVDILIIGILVSVCALIYNFNIKGKTAIQIACVTCTNPPEASSSLTFL